MFAVSTRVRYGLRALIHIAMDQTDRPVALKLIAEKANISHKYLESIFNSLKNAGVVRSSRGPEGGYVLAHDPKKLSMFDIISAIDGPPETTGCVADDASCEKVEYCSARPFWVELQSHIAEFLRSKSLQDLLTSDTKRG